MKYLHYSSRPEPPEVPTRAMNQFAGGTGPVGVYAYQSDARMKTFATERPYVFELEPTVPVVRTHTYTQERLERDLRELAQMIDIAKPVRLWDKYKHEFRMHQLPFTKLWYVIAHVERTPDPEMPISYGAGSGFADPRFGRDLFVNLGIEVIDDRHGIMYATEPEQAVFLTNSSFTARPYKAPGTEPTLGLELAVSDEYGRHFATGVKVTFRYVRNTESSPYFGAKFGQDIEPAGRYMLHNDSPGQLTRGWESDLITFRNPLVIPLSGDPDAIYGPTGWKARLHAATGLKGAQLTRHLKALGYDGIVTVDSTGYTREIVDITQEPKERSMKRNPRDESFEDMIARYRREKDDAIAQIKAALAISPAISAHTSTKPQYDRLAMIIVSGEPNDFASGAFRATYFGDDGPHGHTTRHTMDDIYEEIQRSYVPPFRPMTEDDVIAWTNTEKFITGSKVTAFVQADNSLRYRAQQLGRYDWAAEISRTANALGVERVDEALEMLYAALRELPSRNPRIAGFVANPPWVTKALADSYEELDDQVPSRWLPQLASVQATSRGIVADLVEFGCGSYGCVLATLDPTTVLKVTSDETEADFAARLSPTLAADICVEYRMVVRLTEKHEKRPIHLLWRESARNVGEIDKILDRGALVDTLIHNQHQAGADAFAMLYAREPARYVAMAIEDWIARVQWMGRIPELKYLSDGLIKIWNEQRILFGDLHAGNLGLVTRDGADVWVITDPGNVAVVGR